MKAWTEAQKWESSWWGNCVNTFGEEHKQLLYADKMGLVFFHNQKSPFNIDMEGKSVLDIGGGPCSLLLKCVNLKKGAVRDPLSFPKWVKQRYKEAGIDYARATGEDVLSSLDKGEVFDEVWLYNVLQHTQNPQKIIKNARKVGKTIRIFEWINTPINKGHIHTLTQENLDKWLGGEGHVETLKGQNTCFGECYYGVFITR